MKSITNANGSYNRTMVVNELSSVYFKFLKSIEWDDALFLKGIREGRNKFLSNAYLNLCKGKHSIVNYYSLEADTIIKQYQGRLPKGKLIFEHMVPKEKYIQTPCEEIIKSSSTDNQKLKEIRNLIDRYWYLASITVEQDKCLQYKKTMPENWDKENIFARYENAGIRIISNPIWNI